MVVQGGFDQSNMDTEDKQKAVFDGVDMRTSITEPVIAELLRNFAIAVGKPPPLGCTRYNGRT